MQDLGVITKEQYDERMKEKKFNFTFVDDIGERVFIDEVGGHHSAGLGWNPNGVFCGECGSVTCAICQYKNDKE